MTTNTTITSCARTIVGLTEDNDRQLQLCRLDPDHEGVCKPERSGATPSAPWWKTAPNPPCQPWCEVEHEVDEFSGAASLSCVRVVRAWENRFRVVLIQDTTEDEDNTPGVYEVRPAVVSHDSNHDRLIDDNDARLAFADALIDATADAKMVSVAAGHGDLWLPQPISCPSWCDGDHVRVLFECGSYDAARPHHGSHLEYLLPEVRRGERLVRPKAGSYYLRLVQQPQDRSGLGGLPVVMLETDTGIGTENRRVELPLTTGEARTLARQLIALADREDLGTQ